MYSDIVDSFVGGSENAQFAHLRARCRRPGRRGRLTRGAPAAVVAAPAGPISSIRPVLPGRRGTCRGNDDARSWRSWRPWTPWGRAVRRWLPACPCWAVESPWRWRVVCGAVYRWKQDVVSCGLGSRVRCRVRRPSDRADGAEVTAVIHAHAAYTLNTQRQTNCNHYFHSLDQSVFMSFCLTQTNDWLTSI